MEFDFEFWDHFNESQAMNAQEMSKTDYYLKTGDSEPFCIFHYHILVSFNIKLIYRIKYLLIFFQLPGSSIKRW